MGCLLPWCPPAEPTTEDASGQAANRARLSPKTETLLQVLILRQGRASPDHRATGTGAHGEVPASSFSQPCPAPCS